MAATNCCISGQPNKITGLTQSAFFAFGRAVLYFLILFVFALAERKNEKIIIEKYHAAAGYMPLSNGHRVSPVNDKMTRCSTSSGHLVILSPCQRPTFLRYTTAGPAASNGALRLIVVAFSIVNLSARTVSRLLTLNHSTA